MSCNETFHLFSSSSRKIEVPQVLQAYWLVWLYCIAVQEERMMFFLLERGEKPALQHQPVSANEK